MKKVIKFVGLGTLSILLLTGGAQAQTGVINSKVYSDTKSDFGINIGSSDKPEVNTNSKLQVGLDLNTNSSQTDNDKEDTDTTVNSSNNLEIGTNFSLKSNSSGIVIISSDQVNSDEDLRIFRDNVSSKNKAVAKIDTDYSNNTNSQAKVKVVYKHSGKLLGFIPVTIKSRTYAEAKTNSSTEVESSLAWWGFLVADKNYDKQDVEARIKENSKIQASLKANASAKEKAEIAEAMVSELNANANAQAKINK